MRCIRQLLETVGYTQRNRVLTDRAAICAAIGIKKEQTVTKAMKALKSTGLIQYQTRAKKDKSTGNYAGQYYEISLSKSTIMALTVIPATQGKSTITALPADASSLAKVPLRASYPLKDSVTVPSAIAAVPSTKIIHPALLAQSRKSAIA